MAQLFLIAIRSPELAIGQFHPPSSITSATQEEERKKNQKNWGGGGGGGGSGERIGGYFRGREGEEKRRSLNRRITQEENSGLPFKNALSGGSDEHLRSDL